MLHITNDAHIALVVQSARIEDILQYVDASVGYKIQQNDMEIDCGVPNLSDAENKTRYLDTLKSRWFCAIF